METQIPKNKRNRCKEFATTLKENIFTRIFPFFKKSDLTLEEWARLESRQTYHTRAPKRESFHERIL